MNRADAELWLTCLRREAGAQLRLLCLPYAGGGTLAYRPWAERLPHGVELWAAQLPGREKRLAEPPPDAMSPMVAAIADAVEPWDATSFAVYGHSMGAQLGFELARELRRRGASGPTRLLVSGCVAPQVPCPYPPIHALSDGPFIEELKKLGGTPDEVLRSAELMAFVLPVIRADITLSENYACRDEPPLGCPINVYGGLADPVTDREGLDAWQRQTTGPFKLRMFPGDHFFIDACGAVFFDALAADLQPSPTDSLK